MRNFWLERTKDDTGISGLGVVAEGVQFTNGKCAISWLTNLTSTTIYDDIETVEKIHGHNGDTLIIYDLSEIAGNLNVP